MTILRLSGGEDVRTVLQWRRDLTKVLQGLNLTTPQAKVKVIKSQDHHHHHEWNASNDV